MGQDKDICRCWVAFNGLYSCLASSHHGNHKKLGRIKQCGKKQQYQLS